MSITTRSRLCLALLPLVVGTGCFKQKVAVTLHSNGSGKIHIAQRSGDAISALELLRARTDDEKLARAHASLVTELAYWEGVSAWSNERSDVRDGRIEFEADAYFSDANRLARLEPGASDQRFSLRAIANDEHELRWTFTPASGFKKGTLKHCRGFAAILRETEIMGEVALPGPISSSRGTTGHRDRSATWCLFSGADLESQVSELEALVQCVEISPEEAASQLHSDYAQRTATFQFRDGKLPSAPAGAEAEFRAAERAYDRSELKREVEDRRNARSGTLHPEMSATNF